MFRGIDHLVIACPDPDAAAAELEATLGIACTGGGRHVGGGTFNRLAFLADGSYLELIGIADREVALASPVGAAALRSLDESGGGGGLATYAIREDAIQKAASALGAIGSFGPAVRGSRMRPDGELVEWWTAFPDADLAADATPFLIEHVHAGAEWGAEAMAARAAFRHPIGSPVRLVRLDIASADPPGTAATIHEALGLDFWAVGDLAVADVGPHVIRFVRRREMAVPAVVTLAADLAASVEPRSAELLGLRFDLEGGRLAGGVGRGSDQR
jgi:hypothetical protein